jgi:hypothetical protein
MSFAHHRDAAFLHGFQQGRLRLRRGSVDFVGQQQVGEDWPLMENQLPTAALIFQNRRTENVARKEVRRELNPTELQTQQRRERLNQLRLAKARQPFQQEMPASEQAGNDTLQQFFLTENRFAEPVE